MSGVVFVCRTHPTGSVSSSSWGPGGDVAGLWGTGGSEER